MCFAIAHTKVLSEEIRNVLESFFGGSKFRILVIESNNAKTCLDPSLIKRFMKSLFQNQFSFLCMIRPKVLLAHILSQVLYFCLVNNKIPFISKCV